MTDPQRSAAVKRSWLKRRRAKKDFLVGRDGTNVAFSSYRKKVYDLWEQDGMPGTIEEYWKKYQRGDVHPPSVHDRVGKGATMVANPKSSPKEIAGSHGHKPAGKSILWPAMYRELRQKGMTKEKAARISNAAWNKKHSGRKTNSTTSTRGLAKMDEKNELRETLLKGDCKSYKGKGKKCESCGKGFVAHKMKK